MPKISADEQIPVSRDADDRAWLQRVLCFVGLLLAWRLVFAAIVPLDLIHDEAYYWDWSRQLDWGYYSKPPMIAWIIALATRLGGSTPWAVRLPAVLLGTCGLLVLYAFTARLFNRRAGFWAAVAAAATPGNTVLSLLMTIDAPFVFCWTAALYTAWRMLERRKDRVFWAVATAVVIGVGLLSKQTMFGFLALGGLFVLASPEDRQELFRPALWLTAGAAMLFLTPVIWWNSQHGWVTFQHTSQHFEAAPMSLWQRVVGLGEYVGGQFGVVSPITCLLLVAVAAGTLLAYPRLGRRERYLLCFSAVPLAGVLGLSAFRHVEPNWPAAFYTAAISLVAGWGTGGFNVGPIVDRWRRWFVPGVGVGAVFCVGVYAMPFVLPVVGLSGTKFDLTVRLRGWRELAQQMDEELSRLEHADHALIITAADRAAASELAFYMTRQPRVYTYNGTGQIRSQYDLWDGPRGAAGRNALVITYDGRPPPPELATAFQKVESNREVTVPLGANRKLQFHVWHAAGLKAWPDKVRR
jgi:undecaprenyl-diphosphatase